VDLNLYPEWREPLSATRVSRALGGSIAVHILFFVAFFSLPRVLWMATIVALVDTIMITALTTLGAYLYNLSTDLVGGVDDKPALLDRARLGHES